MQVSSFREKNPQVEELQQYQREGKIWRSNIVDQDYVKETLISKHCKDIIVWSELRSKKDMQMMPEMTL